MMKNIIILIGQPGSGKGTQARNISHETKLPFFSTGDIFRKMMVENDALSYKLKKYIDSGELVPIEIVNKIVSKCLNSLEYQKGCIIDGYPRTQDQVNYLLQNVSANFTTIFLNSSHEVSKKRILGRYNCENCGQIYNKFYSNPIIDDVCDYCGSRSFLFRTDDIEETIERRLNEYEQETKPLIEILKEKTNFFEVNADRNLDKVANEMIKIAKMI